MARFLYIFLLMPLLLGRAFCALEEGVLKINQKVIHPILLEESPGAITVDYLMSNLRSYEKEGALKKVWAVDLTGTYMSADDFQTFMVGMMTRETLPSLRVLVLGTVYLSDENWRHILEYLLPRPSLQVVDVCNTLYSNHRVCPILRRGHTLHETWTVDLSRKIIFAGESYCPRLVRDEQWPREAVAEGFLNPDWAVFHRQYYECDYKRISLRTSLRFLTGDSDEDEQMLEDSSLEGETSQSRPSSVVAQLQEGE